MAKRERPIRGNPFDPILHNRDEIVFLIFEKIINVV